MPHDHSLPILLFCQPILLAELLISFGYPFCSNFAKQILSRPSGILTAKGNTNTKRTVLVRGDLDHLYVANMCTSTQLYYRLQLPEQV